MDAGECPRALNDFLLPRAYVTFGDTDEEHGAKVAGELGP